jgi:hypothetical protein
MAANRSNGTVAVSGFLRKRLQCARLPPVGSAIRLLATAEREELVDCDARIAC